MELGQLLRQRRVKLRLSARSVAQSLGVAESTYRDWENGRSIQGEPYLELSQILGVPLSLLLGAEADLNKKLAIQKLVELEEHVNNLKKIVFQLI